MAADGMDRCIGEVMAAGGDGTTREDAQAMLSLVDERAERLGRERGLPPQDAVAEAGRELAAAEAAAAEVQRRNALLNLQTRLARRQAILNTAAAVTRNGEPDLAHAAVNQVVARNAPARGNRLSAEAVWKTRTAQYAGGLAVALDKAGLLKAFRNGTMERDWGRELYELSMRAAGADDRVGRTGNPAALQIAQAVHGLQQLAKQRLNRAGAWIGDYAGYITRTTHDMDKIRRAGFESWRGFIEPRLSAETFEGVADRGKFLQDTWHALATGVHLADRAAVGMKDPAFTGPGNAAAGLSQSRSLHFNNADAWLDYQQRFGRGSLADQVTGALNRSARQEALMQRWGTNPEAEFKQDFRWLEETQRDAHPDAVVRLRQSEGAALARFDYLTGNASLPANQMAAEIASGLRAVESLSKLGGVAFTHLSSFPTKASELRYHGVGWLERYGDSVASLLQGRGRGEARELADLMLAGTEGMHGSMLSQFHADDAPAGTMAKLTNRFFSLSGLTYMLDAQKAGSMRVMSRHFGRLVDNQFGALPAEAQRTLRSYDIDANDWEALRTAPDHTTVDGRVHLTPDAAQRAGIGTDQADRLALKLHALYADIADRSVITPGIDERALLFRGAAPGSVPGEALRFLAQFKTWGFAAVRQGLGREINGGQGLAGAASGIVQLALGGAVMGYLTMTLKDLFKGQTPRDPRDPKTVMAAMIQGGGFGILGDYVFGEFNRFGQSAVESLAGPTVGTASDLLRVLDIARGKSLGDPSMKKADVRPELLRLAQNNTPFLNLFYVRRALDYLLFHSAQESMNPGYLRRAERSLYKRTGQTYFLSPQTHLHTFGR